MVNIKFTWQQKNPPSINVTFKMKLTLKNGVKIAHLLLDLGIGNILIKKLKSMQSKLVIIKLLSDLGIFP